MAVGGPVTPWLALPPWPAGGPGGTIASRGATGW
jgi:hypothetical protein